MNRRNLSVLLGVTLLAAGALWHAGCEGSDSDLDDQSFRVEPSRVTLSQTQTTVALRAVGGQAPYSWRVSDSTLGSVATNGPTVTYRRTAQNGVNTVQLSDGQGWTARAEITQQDDEAPLTVSPAAATLDNNGDQVVFTGKGGLYPYRWSVGNPARGHLSGTGGSQVLYTRNTQGDNTVVLKDQRGHMAVADVTQPGVSSVAVNPSTASVATNGGTQVFTAVGGTPPYTWTFVVNASGAPPLSPGTGVSTLYVSGGAGTDIIKVVDGNATEAHATITKN